MNVDQEIKLIPRIEQSKSLELPSWVKPIKIGERTFLFKWTFAGWKQLSTEEILDIKSRYRI